jgi:hypothetical protein
MGGYNLIHGRQAQTQARSLCGIEGIENMVEIICHGGQLIIKEIFDALINAGARSATKGEFTRRALYNGKINFTIAVVSSTKYLPAFLVIR